jgi:multidrug efflux pump subunit AcrA (membrane-fusion protein)
MLQKFRSSLFFALALLAAGALLAGCSKKKQGPAQDDAPVIAVSTMVAQKNTIQDYLNLSGDIVAGSSVDVYSDTAGTITRRYVSIGSRVQARDPIADVDPSQPGMQYMASVVRAPISGVVSNLPGQVGQKITQSSVLATISGGGGLEIQLFVAERFIYRIQMELPCQIMLDAYPEDTFRGRVSEISPVVDPSSRTMMIKVNVDNPGEKLKAGMFANVKIITDTREDVIVIPSSAILSRADEQFVYLAVPDPSDANVTIAKRTVIKSGLQVDQDIQITDGITEGDQIIVKGQANLTDGARVNIIK